MRTTFTRVFLAAVLLSAVTARGQGPASAPAAGRGPTSAPPAAGDGAWGGGVDSGGDEGFSFGEEDRPASRPARIAPDSPWSLTGFLRADWALWSERLDDKPLAKARHSLDVALGFKKSIVRVLVTGHLEVDLAYQIEREDHDRATREVYGYQLNTREVLAALTLGDFEITLGRQIVAWGEGDAFSPVDVVNPRDLREPGLSDLDDIRLPVTATRVGWFPGAHRVEAMVIHESDFGYRPAPRSPFSPFNELLLSNPLAAKLLGDRTIFYDHRQPRFGWSEQQFLLRWVYKGQGVDLGLYAASVLDRQGVISIDPAALLASLSAPELRFDVDHQRYTVLGHSGARAVSSFLIKWEVGAEISRPLNTGQFPAGGGVPTVGVDHASLVHTMAGVTWTGVQDLVLTLELWKPWPITPPDDLLFGVDDPYITLRASYKLLRERLTLQTVAMMIGWAADQGWIFRGEVTYEFIDGLKGTAGYITYQPGDDLGMFTGLTSHDRFFLRLRYDFQLI